MDDNRDHPQFDEYRRRAFAAKDSADEYRREQTPPTPEVLADAVSRANPTHTRKAEQ